MCNLVILYTGWPTSISCMHACVRVCRVLRDIVVSGTLNNGFKILVSGISNVMHKYQCLPYGVPLPTEKQSENSRPINKYSTLCAVLFSNYNVTTYATDEVNLL